MALLLSGAALPVFAADLAWTSTRVRGTVIYLSGDRWEEVARGQDLTSASIRTLRSGRLNVEANGLTLELGPSSVLELGSSAQLTNMQLRHYVGTLTIVSTGGAAPVAFQAGKLSLTSIAGEVEVTVSEASTLLSVHSGTVSVRAPGGGITPLPPGEYMASDSGVTATTSATTSVAVAANNRDTGNQSGGGKPADPGANGNGVANGPGNNSAGGNGNGAANGNAGGANGAANSGNPNAGSGNNNGGGNGNGAANGNGTGTANGNGNGPGSNSAGGNGKAKGETNGSGAGASPETDPEPDSEGGDAP